MATQFKKGGDEVDLPNYSPISEKIPKPGTVAGVTSGGTVVAQDVGPDEEYFSLDYVGLTLAQRDLLYDFYLNIVRGSYETFTFTDRDEITEYTVRWWNEWAIKNNEKSDWKAWEGRIILRIEA